MSILLLIIIYISYIGLGIPDSLLGASWPVIYREFGVSVSASSVVSFLICCGTIVSSFLSARLISKLGTGKVGVISTALTAAALFGFSQASGFYSLCLWAIPLGLGAGAIDSAMNNYVALRYSNMQMNFLHCFYGVGVSVSPYLLSLILSDGKNWRRGYLLMFAVQTCITLIMLISLPLWKKADNLSKEPVKPQRLVKAGTMLKNAAVRSHIGVMMTSCGIESVCLVWGATFLSDGKGFTPDKAAQMITVYFLGLALGRFISGLLAVKIKPSVLILAGHIITGSSIIILLLPLNPYFAVIGLFFIGFGNGSIFPNMTHLTPQIFGKDVSQSVISFQMGTCYIAIMIIPPVFGLLVKFVSVSVFSVFLSVLYLIMIISTTLLKIKIKQGKSAI